jgi:glycosyltransferase involved in cell wall biosynthesis
MGRSILEAMACAKPIIASRVGGIPDLVDDGINGILIPPNDSRALAQNLIKLLNDESMRRKLGAAAKEKVSVRYDVNTMVEQISRVYADLIRQKR